MVDDAKQLHSRVFDECSEMSTGLRRRKRWRLVSSNPAITGCCRSCYHGRQHVKGLHKIYLPELIKKTFADMVFARPQLMDIFELKEHSAEYERPKAELAADSA